jgi:hypothetical protein
MWSNRAWNNDNLCDPIFAWKNNNLCDPIFAWKNNNLCDQSLHEIIIICAINLVSVIQSQGDTYNNIIIMYFQI